MECLTDGRTKLRGQKLEARFLYTSPLCQLCVYKKKCEHIMKHKLSLVVNENSHNEPNYFKYMEVATSFLRY